MSDPAPRSRAAFISYSSEDKEWAEAARAALENHGLRCWIAPRDIPTTSNYKTSIIDGLAACKIVVLIFSADANASAHVRREVSIAIQDKMPVLPFRIENVSPNGALEYDLVDIHFLNAFSGSMEDRLEKLVETVRTLTNTPPPRPPSPPRPRRTNALGLVALGVLVVAGVATVPRVRDLFVNPGFGGPVDKPGPDPKKINVATKKEPAPKPTGETPLAKVDEALITETLGMKFVPIPGGEFLMGSDASDPDASSDEQVNGQKHRVRISPFEMGTTEVTVGQFGEFVRRSPYQTEAERDGKGGYGWDGAKGTFKLDSEYTWRWPGFPQTDDHPVVLVSHADAVAFCDWLTKVEGRTYMLPSEAEWEYSCRAGQASRFWFGDDIEELAKVGNVADGTASAKYPDWTYAIKAKDGFVFTAPVGHYNRANDFGLFDMHGNVWEWCADYYDSGYYAKLPSPAVDPVNSAQAADRVDRGGGWGNSPRFCRSAYRDGGTPDYRVNYLGFRVARVRSGQ